MSIGATNWAYRQKIPIKPKFVLQALADQTDERTGRVCYGKTDMKYLAEKCSIPERSLYRYISMLVRNGYVMRESGKEKGQASVYWLCLNRELAASPDAWQSSGAADDDDPQDVAGGSANLAEGLPVENAPNLAEGVCHQMAEGVCHKVADQESTLEPKNIKRSEIGFSKEAQDAEREEFQIKKAAAAAGARVFVIEGSRAWDAWIKHRGRSMPTCAGHGEHAGRRGWYLPSLFPPQKTGPPQDHLSNEDIKAFTGE